MKQQCVINEAVASWKVVQQKILRLHEVRQASGEYATKGGLSRTGPEHLAHFSSNCRNAFDDRQLGGAQH